jgi:hypothetical protein
MAAAMKGWMELPPPISSDITGAELLAEVLLHHGDGQRHGLGIGEALLADQRRAHVGDHGDHVVVVQLGGVHQMARDTLSVELPHVEQREVRAAPAPGAQDPGADGQALDLIQGDRSHREGLIRTP